MQVKTSELSRHALDWAVAKCEGERVVFDGQVLRFPPGQFSDEEIYSPSTQWSQGGLIIDREVFTLERDNGQWFARSIYGATANGPTLLVAAMRCYVGSKLGDVVEVPDELAG